MDVGELGALADSMSASGLHQPIGVRGPLTGGVFEIVYGHRRWTAAKMLKWPDIEAKVYPADYDPLVARTEENGLREQLNPREEARVVKQFLDKNYSQAETARLMRKSYSWIAARVELLTWPQELQDAVAAGAVALSVARELATIDHPGYRDELIREASRTGATQRQAAVWRAHYEADRERIVGNHMAVAEILERREQFYIDVLCESCRARVPATATRLLRICTDCDTELRTAQANHDQAQLQTNQLQPASD